MFDTCLVHVAVQCKSKAGTYQHEHASLPGVFTSNSHLFCLCSFWYICDFLTGESVERLFVSKRSEWLKRQKTFRDGYTRTVNIHIKWPFRSLSLFDLQELNPPSKSYKSIVNYFCDLPFFYSADLFSQTACDASWALVPPCTVSICFRCFQTCFELTHCECLHLLYFCPVFLIWQIMAGSTKKQQICWFWLDMLTVWIPEWAKTSWSWELICSSIQMVSVLLLPLPEQAELFIFSSMDGRVWFPQALLHKNSQRKQLHKKKLRLRWIYFYLYLWCQTMTNRSLLAVIYDGFTLW